MTDYVRPAITEADLMRPENEWVEVVGGELVEINTDMMGILHTIVIHNLYDILKPFIKRHDLGYVHGDGLKYILDQDEEGVQTSRTPDLAFLRKGRILADLDFQRPFLGAPDFALEVSSQGQSTADMLSKVADYLRYGTQEVWVVYPPKRELHRYRSGDEAPEYYREDDVLQSDALFPGLKVKIADLFVVEAS